MTSLALNPDLASLRSHFEGLTDLELLDIAVVRPEQYEPAATTVARQELDSRGVRPRMELIALEAARGEFRSREAEETSRRAEQQLSWPGKLYFFLDPTPLAMVLIILCFPAGKTRKAKTAFSCFVAGWAVRTVAAFAWVLAL